MCSWAHIVVVVVDHIHIVLFHIFCGLMSFQRMYEGMHVCGRKNIQHFLWWEAAGEQNESHLQRQNDGDNGPFIQSTTKEKKKTTTTMTMMTTTNKKNQNKLPSKMDVAVVVVDVAVVDAAAATAAAQLKHTLHVHSHSHLLWWWGDCDTECWKHIKLSLENVYQNDGVLFYTCEFSWRLLLLFRLFILARSFSLNTNDTFSKIYTIYQCVRCVWDLSTPLHLIQRVHSVYTSIDLTHINFALLFVERNSILFFFSADIC